MCMGMREFDIVNRASIINFDIEILINKQCCFMFFLFLSKYYIVITVINISPNFGRVRPGNR